MSADMLVLTDRRARWAVRVSRRGTLLTVFAATAAVWVAAASLTLGEFPISLAEVLDVLAGGGTLIDRDVVLGDRLPRAVTGLGVGAAFALSGAILQRIARNPLVSPDVIGINSGAALGALLVITVVGGSGAAVVISALTGALLASAVILLVAYRRGLHGFRLVLVGIGVAAMLTSGISYLLTRADVHEAMSAAAWLTGSLANRDGMHVAVIGTTLVLVVPVLAVVGRQLRLLELGDELATSLGSRQQHRIALVLVAVTLAAMATAAAGPIAFVALVAPQITRRLLAERHVGLAPSAAVGALLVVAADLAARLLFAPAGMPVGVVTAVLGAPVLLFLLARANRIGSAG